MQKTVSANITDEQMRDTWRAIKQPGWGTFEQSLAHPIRARVIRIAAVTRANKPQPGRDGKCAAANDKE